MRVGFALALPWNQFMTLVCLTMYVYIYIFEIHNIFFYPEAPPSHAADHLGTLRWTYKQPGGQKLNFKLSTLFEY